MPKPTPYYQKDGITIYCITIYCGDCREILASLPQSDLVFTSPPYAQQRDYTAKIENWDDLMIPAFQKLRIKENGQILVNLGLVHREEVMMYWNNWIADMRKQCYRLFGWYVWDQGVGLPGDWGGRLAPSHEFIFHFNKVAKQPNKTDRCKSFGTHTTGTGLRKADGTMSGRSKNSLPYVQEFKIPDSIIRIARRMSRNGLESKHPAPFPLSLAHRIVTAYSSKGDIVLDPFMGSGTTLVEARYLNRQAIGIDIEERYCKIAVKRIKRILF